MKKGNNYKSSLKIQGIYPYQPLQLPDIDLFIPLIFRSDFFVIFDYVIKRVLKFDIALAEGIQRLRVFRVLPLPEYWQAGVQVRRGGPHIVIG